MIAIGIEIGGTKLQLIAVNREMSHLDHRRATIESARGADSIRDALTAELDAMLKKLADDNSGAPQVLGVGFGGPVDWVSGRIARSVQVEGWRDFPLAGWLTERFGIPAFVENDSNTAAFAEALYGAGEGCNPVFYSNCGSGVGAGLVCDGVLYHGRTPGEMELGHVWLDRDGTTVEDRCSGWSLDERVKEMARTHPNSALARLVAESPPGSARHLGAALAEDDVVAQSLLAEAAREYAFALCHAVHLMHPEVIVLGGGVSLLGEPWRLAVAKHLPEFLFEPFQPGLEVRLAALGEAVVPLGAAAIAIKRLEEANKTH